MKRRIPGAIACATLAMLFGAHPIVADAQQGATHTLAMVPPASDRVNRGLVRIINRSNRRGTVRITAIDDTGWRFGPVSLPMSPRQTRHVTSAQLERGGAGLSGGVGDGAGNWRLVLTANLDIEALAYILAGDGSLSGMNALAAESRHGATWRYDVPYFQPASRGRLRLVNPGAGAARVTITGVDDRGAAGDGAVRMTVAAGAARNPTTEALEQGDDNLSGWLGDGTGRWRLTVSSNRQLLVMSLLRNPGGHLVNLSHGEASVSVEPPPPPPSFAPDLVVRSPSVSDDSLTAGQSFTLRATVHNQGGRRSVATRLLYYRSSDATISTADTRVGADTVVALAPSGTSPESIVSRAPARAGTYYYGACVNAVSGESNTRNNCSSAVRVRVTAPASDDHGNTPSTATPVSIPSSTAGRLERSTDRDYFRVVVRQTGTYQAETTGSTDTFGRLLASDGRTVLVLDDDDGTGSNFRITRALTAGTYFIEVRGYSGATGSYTLRVSRVGTGSDYWGAIAAGWQGQYCGDGYGWSAAWNYSSRAAAVSAAESACRNQGLRSCGWVAAFNACGSLAYGESATSCGLYGGLGSTRSAAESSALSTCRAAQSDCRISVSPSGERATYCNSGAGAPPRPISKTADRRWSLHPLPRTRRRIREQGPSRQAPSRIEAGPSIRRRWINGPAD